MFGNQVDIEQTFGKHDDLMHRTYVRRRIVLLLAGLGVTGVLAGPITAAFGADGQLMRPVADRTYVVEPGDTLWAIASQVAGGRDPRQVVDEIEARNQIDAGSLQPGTVLHVPAAR
ncbi:MAG TPA: LysM peptidoglycan-binding domain-containing protein [Actinomycetota bacterium]